MRGLSSTCCTEAKLAEKCSDLQSRARRKNLQIYGVTEGKEKNDMIRYVTELLKKSLNLPDNLTIHMESTWVPRK